MINPSTETITSELAENETMKTIAGRSPTLTSLDNSDDHVLVVIILALGTQCS